VSTNSTTRARSASDDSTGDPGGGAPRRSPEACLPDEGEDHPCRDHADAARSDHGGDEQARQGDAASGAGQGGDPRPGSSGLSPGEQRPFEWEAELVVTLDEPADGRDLVGTDRLGFEAKGCGRRLAGALPAASSIEDASQRLGRMGGGHSQGGLEPQPAAAAGCEQLEGAGHRDIDPAAGPPGVMRQGSVRKHG
jgi:hypothetical protein